MFKSVVIAYDHRVEKKVVDNVKAVMAEKGIQFEEVLDAGEANDYPLLAKEAYLRFKNMGADGLVLLCGTGVGMNIVANKFDGIRAVLATSEAEAYFARRHENANCIVFGAGYSDGVFEVKLCSRKMQRMLKVFLQTDFEAGRHIRRVEQISQIEKGKI